MRVIVRVSQLKNDLRLTGPEGFDGLKGVEAYFFLANRVASSSKLYFKFASFLM